MMLDSLLAYPQALLGPLWPVVWTLVKIMLIVAPLMLCVAYLTLWERKLIGYMQIRKGPNRVTFFGIRWLGGWAQPIADGLKLLVKEVIIPTGSNKILFVLAPVMALGPALAAWAVIPFSPELILSNIDAGLLYLMAMTSLGVYGIVLAGWASNSKYPFLGGIRSSSQMISYELALGLSVIPVFMVCGTLSLPEIVLWQRENGWMVFPIWAKGLTWDLILSGDIGAIAQTFTAGFSLQRILLWVPMIISFVIFLIAMFAETNRAPFDLPEAEQELVGGYHTEYSGMGFALFFLGEYAAMIAGSGVIVTLFLGGWSFPLIPDGSLPGIPGVLAGLVNIGVFFAKIIALLVLFIWVRWTVPRFRYDQLMKLGWYVFFELALVNIFIAAFVLAYIK